jgi:hypothetical protein
VLCGSECTSFSHFNLRRRTAEEPWGCATLASLPFQDSVNKTILATLPIIDDEPLFSLPLGAIIGIVVGSLSGLLAFVMCIWLCLRVRRGVKAQRVAGPAPASSGSLPNTTIQIPFGAPPVFRFPGADQTATSESQPMLGFQKPSMLGAPSSHASANGPTVDRSTRGRPPVACIWAPRPGVWVLYMQHRSVSLSVASASSILAVIQVPAFYHNSGSNDMKIPCETSIWH